MTRAWIWLQLLIGWLPVWALFTTLILTAHPHSRFLGAGLIALRMMVAAAALGFAVHRLIRRFPWPHPFTLSFAAIHLVGAVMYAVAWLLLNSVIESVFRGQPVIVIGYGLGPFLVLGVWLYVMVAGVAYASQAAERAARAEAMAARSQLAALRAQLNPHFLFNVLHTVVQLIPRDPRRAGQAAEQLAGLLRATIEEDRDLITVREEWAFVERYLEIERLRYGERLNIRVDLSEEAAEALIPSFGLQTLVENAVRHGAAPKVGATEIVITGAVERGRLTLQVRDTGAGAPSESLTAPGGTGLGRLRDRLAVLSGSGARLDVIPNPGGGVVASLVVPA